MSRKDRPIFEGHVRSGDDRRQTTRRKSDVLMGLMKLVAVALLAALITKIVIMGG